MDLGHGRSILEVRMIGPIVLLPRTSRLREPTLSPFNQIRIESTHDPLSECSPAKTAEPGISGSWFPVIWPLLPKHQGVKLCMLAGECWLAVEGVPDPVLLHAGDCFFFRAGFLPARHDLSLDGPLHAGMDRSARRIACQRFLKARGTSPEASSRSRRPRRDAPSALPPIVHIRASRTRLPCAGRWSECARSSATTTRRFADCAAARLHHAHPGAAPALD